MGAWSLAWVVLTVCVLAASNTAAQQCEYGHTLEGLEADGEQKFVVVGGKGGVGKTTVAGSIAVRLTDPAHSLGDYFRRESISEGRIVRLLNSISLYVIEINPANAMEEFNSKIDKVISKLMTDGDESSPRWKAIAAVRDLFSTLPPGADEFIALAKLMHIGLQPYEDKLFHRIVVDTAASGHTLRLLQSPSFLEGFLNETIAITERTLEVFSATGSVGTDVTDAMQALRDYQDDISRLWKIVTNPRLTDFVVVCHPTVVAASETRRMIESLHNDRVEIGYIVVNMLIADEPTDLFSRIMIRLQQKHIYGAQDQYEGEEKRTVIKVDHQIQEPRGMERLRRLAKHVYDRQEGVGRWGTLFQPAEVQTQFIGFIGKGGVGKTALSCATGIQLAKTGLKTLILSTDPSHSLGDTLDLVMSPGEIVEVPGTDGSLFALEIDPKAEIDSFSSLIREAMNNDADLKLQHESHLDLILPPGTDELVAFTHLYRHSQDAQFARVVVDTPATGLTLRMLGTPTFLNRFTDRITTLVQALNARHSADEQREKTKIASAQLLLLAPDSSCVSLAINNPVWGQKRRRVTCEKLEELRSSSLELLSLLSNQRRVQFAAVVVPLEIVLAESTRMMATLSQLGMNVNNVFLNQIYPMESPQTFFTDLRREQELALAQLESYALIHNISLVKMVHLDRDVHGIEGSLHISDELFDLRRQKVACGDLKDYNEMDMYEKPWRPE